MTFTEIVTEILDRLNLRSPEAETRVGRAVNRLYRSITTSTGLNTTRTVLGVSGTITSGQSHATFSSVEKIVRVYDSSSGSIRDLKEVTLLQMREENLGTGIPTKWAVRDSGATSVTLLFNSVVQENTTLYADGLTTVSDLSGSNVPALPISFHDILIEGVLIDEYKRLGKLDYARDSLATYKMRLSDLQYFLAKNAYQDIYQGASAQPKPGPFSGGSGGSAPSGGTSYTQTGLITFDRDPAAPFAVSSGSAMVENLNAETLGAEGYTSTDVGILSEDETVTGNWGFANDIILHINPTGRIRPNTADGVDTLAIEILGGGASSLTRGARLIVAGNENVATPGVGALQAGNIAGGFVALSRSDGGHSVHVDGTTGLVTLNHGQLKFPAAQNASTDVNTLDDYEEGSWSPTITGTGGASGQVYSLQAGRYVKKGKEVFVTGRVTLSTLGTVTTQAAIGNLPFTAENIIGISGGLTINFWSAFTATYVTVTATVIANTTTASLHAATAAATGLSSVVQADLSNTSDIVFSGSYLASA